MSVRMCMYVCTHVWQSALLTCLNAFRTASSSLFQKLSHPPMLCPAIIYSHPQIPNQSSPPHLYMSSALTHLNSRPSNTLHICHAYIWIPSPFCHQEPPSWPQCLTSLPAQLPPFLYHLLSPPTRSAQEEAEVLVHCSQGGEKENGLY